MPSQLLPTRSESPFSGGPRLAVARPMLLVALLTAACGDDGGDGMMGGVGDDDDDDVMVQDAGPAEDGGPADGGPPDAGPGDAGMGGGDDPFTGESFQAFLDESCSGGGCHIGFAFSPAAGMDLTDHTTGAVDVPAGQSDFDRIEPGDHQRSYLWHKVNGTHRCPDPDEPRCDGLPAPDGVGSQMPLGRAPLMPSDVDRIADYIDGL